MYIYRKEMWILFNKRKNILLFIKIILLFKKRNTLIQLALLLFVQYFKIHFSFHDCRVASVKNSLKTSEYILPD